MTKQFDEEVEKSFILVRNPALWPETPTDQLVDHLVTLSVYLGVS